MPLASNYTKDFPVSWEELHRNARALAWRLLGKGPLEGGKWKGVIGVTRGGLVPACIMARELEILLIDTLCISSYDIKDQSKTTNILKKATFAEDGGHGWLVIDDLVDTGNTYKIAREMLPKAHYGCIYAKPQGLPTVDTFVMEVSQDTWIHFPWDLENKYATPLARMDRPGE